MEFAEYTNKASYFRLPSKLSVYLSVDFANKL